MAMAIAEPVWTLGDRMWKARKEAGLEQCNDIFARCEREGAFSHDYETWRPVARVGGRISFTEEHRADHDLARLVASHDQTARAGDEGNSVVKIVERPGGGGLGG